MIRRASLLLLFVSFWPNLFAQAVTSLNGIVLDPTGAVIPGAKLTLTHVDTGASRDEQSDSQGRYVFAQLQPGTYKLSAKAQGFNDVVYNEVRLLVNTPATINVAFEKIGATLTTVQVEAAAVQVNTTDASLGNAIG